MHPSLVFLDFETTGLEYYRDDFQVTSMAMCWRDENGEINEWFSTNSDEINSAVEHLSKHSIPVCVFNVGFELGVFTCRFPGYPINITIDCMRLCQLFDNGDLHFRNPFLTLEDEDEEEAEEGMGLKVAGPRILGNKFIHAEQEAHDWIFLNLGVNKSKAGAYLSQLPENILRRYNVADVINTMNLYETITEVFRDEGYDWSVDHTLYMSTAKHVVDSKIAGVSVDRITLAEYAQTVEAEISAIEEEFKQQMAVEIAQVEELMWEEEKAKRKTEKGKAGVSKPEFNVGSNKQLADLFVKVLGMEIKFTTPKEQPSFKKAHLHSWGDGGLILQKRRQRMIVLKQAQALLGLSEYDGRWHLSLRAVGTKSGRMSGASG
jgi:DNA polymerase I-like protein with 3'-5' exonuclease and polymerase domains